MPRFIQHSITLYPARNIVLIIIAFGVIAVLLCTGSTAAAITTVSLSKCT